MPQEFYAGLESAHMAARRHRERVDEIRKKAQETPVLLAAEVMEAVPKRLLELRVIATKNFGLDLTSAEQIRSFAATSVAEWQLVSRVASQYQMYSACLQLITRYVEDPNLTGVHFARTVCEAFLEALERLLYTVALDFEQLRRMLPEQQFASEELAQVLTGVTATRISLHTNVSLRKQIDELRAGSKQKTMKRERFEQLLLELPAAVLEVWEKTPHPVGSLDAIRTEAAARLVSPPKVRAITADLSHFAVREKLLNQAKKAGLTPREHELFALVMKDPERYFRTDGKLNHKEAAQAMGLAVGSTKSLWARIKKSLAA